MQIEFLGTSHGVPHKTRYCSAVLLTVGERRYLFDAGAPVVDLFLRREYPLTSLHGIFITHMHGDHLAGLLPLVDLCNWYFRDTAYPIYLPEEAGPALLAEYVRATAHATLRPALVPQVYAAGEVYHDAWIRVSAVPVDHAPGFTCYGYLIEAEGKRIYLTGDMSHDLHDFPAFLYSEPVDLLITEAAHCTAETLVSLLARTQATRVCLTHAYPLSKLDECMALQGRCPMPLLVAEDGMQLPL